MPQQSLSYFFTLPETEALTSYQEITFLRQLLFSYSFRKINPEITEAAKSIKVKNDMCPDNVISGFEMLGSAKMIIFRLPGFYKHLIAILNVYQFLRTSHIIPVPDTPTNSSSDQLQARLKISDPCFSPPAS